MSELKQKISALVALGSYMNSKSEDWQIIKTQAIQGNQWFTPYHIEIAIANIVQYFLQANLLNLWITAYQLPTTYQKVGITMAGNLPLVGFHDFLCAYLSGHQIQIKLSSKDNILLPHLVNKLSELDPDIVGQIHFSEHLRQCDAYIATGSNNSARYFEQYFAKYPHIIRRNRTSVAVLTGNESVQELRKLAEDVFLYFGLGCRNVTKIFVPRGYDFKLLFEAFEPYREVINHHKYRNNYDYYLAIYLLNKVPYLSNDFILLVENDSPFSAVSVLHYQYYDELKSLMEVLLVDNDLQCVISSQGIPFGQAQVPSLSDYADGVDTMDFLCKLGKK